MSEPAVTDIPLRDQIAQLLRETYDREFDGEGGEWTAMADAVVALLVPRPGKEPRP